MCFACMSVCVLHAWVVAEETGRGCVISWNWSSRQIPGAHVQSQKHSEQLQCQYFYSEMGDGERVTWKAGPARLALAAQ